VNGRTRWLVAGGLVGAVALFLLPLVIEPDGVPYAPGATYTDLLTAHLPSAWLLHRSLTMWRTVPLWNPTILSGIPFAADPLSGLWYPPQWLAAIWPRPLTYNILTAAHLLWAGFGVMQIARRMGLGTIASLVGAFAFAGAPKLIGHIGLGHISLVYAVCWLPWVVWATLSLMARLLDQGGGIPRGAALLGGMLALVFLIDPRWSIPSAVVMAGVALAAWFGTPSAARPASRKTFLAVLGVAVFAVAGSAGLALPLLEWVNLTTRSGLSTGGSTLALPAANFVGLFVPQTGASPELLVSAGIVVLMLAAVGFLERGRGAWLWVGLVVGGWILALGDATPVGAGLAHLPGWNLLRVPPRWLFVSSLGLAVLCAQGAEAILESSRGVALRRSTRIAAAVILGGTVTFAAALLLLGPPSRARTLVFLVTPALAVGAFVAVAMSHRFSHRAAGLLVALFVFVDLFVIDHALLETRSLMAQERVTAGPWFWTDDIGAGSRLFSPSYAVPQDAAAQLGLELADGVHPLQLRAYVDWMAEATGFERADYSVTLPPFPTGDPKQDWGPRLDAGQLGKLSVEFVLSDYPLNAPGWEAAGPYAGIFAYANPEVRPRAWLEDVDGGWTPATIVDRSPNRIRLRASGPGRLVLSEVAYPGWKVQIDGKPASILTVDGLLRGVDLGAGEHNVTFAFRPASLYAGLTLTIMTLVTIAWLWGRRP
jgi:hypothetical protein